MRVYVIHGCIQFEDFEWIEGIHQTLKGARVHKKALEKRDRDQDDKYSYRDGYYYRISKYVLQV